MLERAKSCQHGDAAQLRRAAHCLLPLPLPLSRPLPLPLSLLLPLRLSTPALLVLCVVVPSVQLPRGFMCTRGAVSPPPLT